MFMMQPKADPDFYAELLKRSSGASRRKEKGCKRTLYELAVAPLAPAASNRGWYIFMGQGIEMQNFELL